MATPMRGVPPSFAGPAVILLTAGDGAIKRGPELIILKPRVRAVQALQGSESFANASVAVFYFHAEFDARYDCK